jgi:polyamine oxidase
VRNGVITLATGIFDDRRTDVPAGVTGPVERVVVVGAGISGLTVANALTYAGVGCVVLEARDRIGGRLHTIDLAGVPIDMGGSWIHHPVGNPMRAFAEQAHIACAAGDPVPTLTGYDCGERRRLSRDEVEASLAMAYEAFPEAVEMLRIELGPLASVAEAVDAFLAGKDLPPHEARRARQGLRAVIEAEAAGMSETQSLQWMWNEFEYEGDYFGVLPAGGYRSVVETMAAGVDVRLGVEVTDVEVTANGVAVRTADGGRQEASHVVVAVPLGVLKRGAPRFAPSLPADRIAAIERLGFGHFEKVSLRFDEPFWRASGLSHLMLFPPDPAEATTWVIDQADFGAGSALTAIVFASNANHVLGATPDAAAQWLLDMLAQANGGSCPAPTAIAVSSWGTDPYSGGSYTHIPPGAEPADADLLGEPIGGRLLFAGEHTQSERLAYVDGAMVSGIREAKRLLRQPTVHLTAP